MQSNIILKKFLKFFEERDHKILPNVSLVPENDPTSLFIMSGVQPIASNILSAHHPLGNRLASIQRCLRMDDIEEVGDNRHLTFFQMMGNWSIGDYYKKEALEWSFKFFVEELKLDPKRIYATVFCGENDIPMDLESVEIWKKLFKNYGIKAELFEEGKNIKDARIFALSSKDNFWGPPGGVTGPCGPSSELNYYFRNELPNFKKFRPGYNDSNYFVELWNDVFMQYFKAKDGKLLPLEKKCVDTGSGFERICSIVQKRKKDGSLDPNFSVFETDLFDKPANFLFSTLGKKLQILGLEKIIKQREFRIVLDHIKAVVFLLADGVIPSNKDQGYILRRLLRRAIRYARMLEINENFSRELAKIFIEKNSDQYPNTKENESEILNQIEKEEISFKKTITNGQKELDKIVSKNKLINGKILFDLYQSTGFPVEFAIDSLKISNEKEKSKIIEEYNKAETKHKIISKRGVEKKFRGGLADYSEISTRYHTATHLLLKALQIVLGDHVHQRGSNITSERLRFDFSHPKKLTSNEIKKVEEIVQEKINAKLAVVKKEMPLTEALKLNAEHEFNKKYPEKVSIYSIIEKDKSIFSSEFCFGPHVSNTGELAKSGKFKIIKEEGVAKGIRRIKAVLK